MYFLVLALISRHRGRLEEPTADLRNPDVQAEVMIYYDAQMSNRLMTYKIYVATRTYAYSTDRKATTQCRIHRRL